MNTFSILSGDARQKYLNDFLNAHGFHAYIKSNFDFHDDWIIVCGTPFSKDGTYLNCDFYSSYPIDTFIKLLQPGQLVFGGNIPQWVMDAGKEREILFVDVLKDEDVVWNNAMLTAEGLLGKIIENTNFSIQHARALVIGFGKCGMNIADRLDALGCHVFVYDHTPVHLSQASALGYHSVSHAHLMNKMEIFDIIINTVPSVVLTEPYLQRIQQSCVLFEIASKPYGLREELVKKYNLSLITCPGLPGKTAPKTAGELIAKSIISYVERTGINGSQL